MQFRNSAPAYLYELTHRPSKSFTAGITDEDFGVVEHDDLSFLLQRHVNRIGFFFFPGSQLPSYTFFITIYCRRRSLNKVCSCSTVLKKSFYFQNAGLEYAVSTPEDRRVRDVMTTMWANFARHGDPTPYRDGSLPKWDPFKVSFVPDVQCLNVYSNLLGGGC